MIKTILYIKYRYVHNRQLLVTKNKWDIQKTIIKYYYDIFTTSQVFKSLFKEMLIGFIDSKMSFTFWQWPLLLFKFIDKCNIKRIKFAILAILSILLRVKTAFFHRHLLSIYTYHFIPFSSIFRLILIYFLTFKVHLPNME